MPKSLQWSTKDGGKQPPRCSDYVLTLPHQLPRGADQHGDGSASSNGVCRITPVLDGVLISLRCAR